MQKIRDESAGPQIAFLLRDLDSKVQMAAIETTGLLRNQEAVPDLIDVLNRASDAKVQTRGADGASPCCPTTRAARSMRSTCTIRTTSMRAAAAEGFARLRNPADLPNARAGLEG